ncbi:uncharacterized protein [Ptychodera flava]|uniref:uncharacterized protein n=1 Tax=Ptychodera flava TaxID=63121 RepID=UPI00396A5F64
MAGCTTETFKQQIEAAQRVSLDIQQVAGESVFTTVEALANAVGCPKEFIFFPLLSVCASMMGNNAVIRINAEWKEPAILWTMIAAKRGEKKTAALGRILQPIQEIQSELHQEIKRLVPGISPGHLPRLYMDNLENVQTVMSKSGRQMICLFDDISSVFQRLESSAGGCTLLNTNTLSSLYDGVSWSNHANESADFMDKTCLNLSGFTSLTSLIEIMQKTDTACLFDRFLVFIPPSVSYNFNDYRAVPDHIPKLKKVYNVLRRIHQPEATTTQSPIVYSFNTEALQLFGDYHDEFRRRISEFPASEDCHSLFSKAIGQIGRLSGTLQALENAFNVVARNEEVSRRRWNQTITMDKVWCARVIVDYAIQQKLAMLPAEVRLVTDVGTTAEAMRYVPNTANVNMMAVSSAPEPVPTNIIVTSPRTVSSMSTSTMNFTPHTVSEARYKHGSFNHQMRPSGIQSISKRQGTSIKPRYMVNRRTFGGRVQPLSKMTSQEVLMHYPKKIKKILEFPLPSLSLSTISQKKMMPRQNGVKNAFSTESAKEFVSKIAAMGFGSVELKSHPQNGRRSHQFVKRNYEEIPEDAKEIIKRLRVDVEKYQECFRPRDNQVPTIEHYQGVDVQDLQEVNKFEVARSDCQQEDMNTVILHIPPSLEDNVTQEPGNACAKVETYQVE